MERILTTQVLSRIVRYNIHNKQDRVAARAQKKFKPKDLLKKSQDPSNQFDNLQKVLKVTGKIYKRIQLLRAKDNIYKANQPQYILHGNT